MTHREKQTALRMVGGFFFALTITLYVWVGSWASAAFLAFWLLVLLVEQVIDAIYDSRELRPSEKERNDHR